MRGQAVNLGGGVWKKKLNDNMDRSIIVAKGRRYWIFVLLFQKNVRENIDRNELAIYKLLATTYEAATDAVIDNQLKNKDLVEICHGEFT